jgi:poly(3-hydroxybutyrate) depolymerase
MAAKRTDTKPLRTLSLLAAALAAVAVGLSLPVFTSAPAAPRPAAPVAPRPAATPLPVQVERFAYTSHDGERRYALLLLPGWYRAHDHPAIPLVIAPHGRNTRPESAAKRWADLPTSGGFAVVLPAGEGRVLPLYSWGYPGQIADLARMPELAEQAVPGFHYLRDRVYAVGTSMGGQEALLLLARHPELLAGVIAFDPATDLADRYEKFAQIPGGREEQRRARIELGGTPAQVPAAYRARSPIAYARRIAASNVPLEVWWSTTDEVIVDQSRQAGRLVRLVEHFDPEAPVYHSVGSWSHACESQSYAKLPAALARMGLLPATWLTHDHLYRPEWKRLCDA